MSERPYPVAAYFTERARQIAAGARYTSRCPGYRADQYRRDNRGRCPIGVMLEVDDFGRQMACPEASKATAALFARHRGEDTAFNGAGIALHAVIKGAVVQFIRDWDLGEIVDLAEALGVTERARSARTPLGGTHASEAEQ